jgi:hypothetical protein
MEQTFHYGTDFQSQRPSVFAVKIYYETDFA